MSSTTFDLESRRLSMRPSRLSLHIDNKCFILHFYLVTRQMKTIAYSLASVKCMEEGWTVRPPSPLLSDTKEIPDPFVIEVNPLQLVSAITF